MEGKTSCVVIYTQRGMFETPGAPPVLDAERLPGNIEGPVRSVA